MLISAGWEHLKGNIKRGNICKKPNPDCTAARRGEAAPLHGGRGQKPEALGDFTCLSTAPLVLQDWGVDPLPVSLHAFPDSWDFKQSTRNISPTINQANIVDLHPASVYSIRMYSFNKIGRSEPSKELTISTEEAGADPSSGTGASGQGWPPAVWGL